MKQNQIFYIADTHFSHKNILRFDNRPFETVDEMDKTLMKNWNNAVGKNDTVMILGDFCWLKEDRWIEILEHLNGNKVLIKGNHCLKHMSGKLKDMFQDIKDYKEITDNGRHIIMCHYPILAYKSSYNPTTYMLHGHTHKTREQQFVEKWTKELRDSRQTNSDSYGNIINVGCMLPYMNYMPRTLDEIIEGYKEFTKDKN